MRAWKNWKSLSWMLSVLFALPATLEAGTRLRVAHLSPDAPAVDVAIDGEKILENVPFLAASDYLSVDAGQYRVQVTPAGMVEPVVIDATVTVESGTSYTVAATGLLGGGDLQPLVVIDDSVSLAGEAKVRFVHASPDAPAVDVALAGGDVLIAGVAFRESSDYIRVPSGSYDLEVRIAGTSAAVLSLDGVELDGGFNYDVYAVGLAGDGTLSALTLTSAEPLLLPTELRVAHLSPDAPAVDIWVDGAVALSSVEFGEISGYLRLAAGTYRVQVTPAGADSPVVIDADVTIENGRSYTVAATGSLAAGDLQPAVYADERTVTSESSSVRFIHASPDAPAVDIAAAGGPVLFAGVEFRQGTEYLALDAGTYDLEVRLAGTETVALSVPSVILSPGANSTIFAIGLAGDGSLAALPVIDVDGFFLRGDANRDGELDISDPVAVLFHLFLTQPARFCSDAADVDDDGHLMLSDAIYSLNHLFAGGRQPAPPFPAPGIDATADLLGCEDRMRF